MIMNHSLMGETSSRNLSVIRSAEPIGEVSQLLARIGALTSGVPFLGRNRTASALKFDRAGCSPGPEFESLLDESLKSTEALDMRAGRRGEGGVRVTGGALGRETKGNNMFLCRTMFSCILWKTDLPRLRPV